MDELKSLISYKTEEYGQVRVKLAPLLAARNITRNRLSTLTGVKYEVIDRYYKAANVERVDLDLIARICCVLDCQVEDILEYAKAE